MWSISYAISISKAEIKSLCWMFHFLASIKFLYKHQEHLYTLENSCIDKRIWAELGEPAFIKIHICSTQNWKLVNQNLADAVFLDTPNCWLSSFFSVTYQFSWQCTIHTYKYKTSFSKSKNSFSPSKESFRLQSSN